MESDILWIYQLSGHLPRRARQNECGSTGAWYVIVVLQAYPKQYNVGPAEKEHGPIVQPIFISVDPARDSVAQVARYVSDFHPRLIGLTGDYAAVKATCKAYRVYFSTPPDAKPSDDYLVDHSIFFYFMDPNGQFVDAFGKASTVDDVVARVQKEISQWEQKTGRKV